MPSFNSSLNEYKQFIIGVKVFPLIKNKNDYDNIIKNSTNYRALVDTGANSCCISNKIVADLRLQPYKQIEVMTAGEPHTTFAYRVGIAVSITEPEMRPEKQTDGSTIMKPFSMIETSRGFPQVEVSSFPDVGTERGFDMLLGMDILDGFHITMYRGNIFISI